MNVAPYRKFIVAVLGAISVAVSDGVLDTADLITTILAALSALGVYVVPNELPPPTGEPVDQTHPFID